MVTTGMARGPYAKTERIRRRILDAAMEVFAESGFRGSSLRTIAERVGMTQAGVLHHFESKTKLLVAVLELRDEESIAALGPEEPHGIAGIRALPRVLERNASLPGLVSLFSVLQVEATNAAHPAHSFFVQRYRSVLSRMEKSFTEAKAQGEVNSDLDPASAARATIAVMDGLQVQWLLDPGAVDMPNELRRFLRCFGVDDV
jgi:AcrR family transcriptional regulator